MRSWDNLPSCLQNDAVRPYYDILSKKHVALFFKRILDVIVSLVLLIILSPVYLILAIAIKIDSKGPVFYRQVRVTRYGETFRIHKFRSMCDKADQKGTHVTVSGDKRVTRVGKIIRKCRLDEIAQLLDVLTGKMSFVGTRPEVPEYVDCYSDEMMATLLMPAGITSEACINFKDEADLLNEANDPSRTYVEVVLPAKMKWNLKSVREFGFFNDILTMIRTALAVIGIVKPKEYEEDDCEQETVDSLIDK